MGSLYPTYTSNPTSSNTPLRNKYMGKPIFVKIYNYIV